MTELEELRYINKMEPAMKSFMRIFEEAKEIALRGGTKLDMKTTKKAYFLDNLAGVPAGDPILEGGTKEEMAEKMYQSQLNLIKIFRDKGFTVTETEPSSLILLDTAGKSQQELAMEELERKYTEKNVEISWAE